MNIISGSLKGRRIIYDKKLNVRPTTSKSKAGVYNTLKNLYDWSKIRVLDLFSGSGNISYEFASRGVKNIYCVDNNYDNIKFIKKTSMDLKIDLNIIKYDFKKFLKKNDEKFDIIFADPPYSYSLQKLTEIVDLIFCEKSVTKGGIFLREHNDKIELSNHNLFYLKKKYGSNCFSFFKKKGRP